MLSSSLKYKLDYAARLLANLLKHMVHNFWIRMSWSWLLSMLCT